VALAGLHWRCAFIPMPAWQKLLEAPVAVFMIRWRWLYEVFPVACSSGRLPVPLAARFVFPIPASVAIAVIGGLFGS